MYTYRILLKINVYENIVFRQKVYFKIELELKLLQKHCFTTYVLLLLLNYNYNK